MRDFYSWLEEKFPGGVVLVGHDDFSNKSLVREFRNARISDDEIRKIITGFSDTLAAFQKFSPGNYTL